MLNLKEKIYTNVILEKRIHECVYLFAILK